MNLHRLIAQMVVVRASGHLYDRQRQYPQWELPNAKLQSLIQDYGVGGVILLGGSAPEVYLRIQQLQAWAEHPLLIAADVEEGVGQRFGGATRFPPAMALEHCDPGYAYEFGRITAQEASSLGINWLLAPVADINSNPVNPVINVRAFGNSPEVVIPRVRAFIKGAQNYPVLTTVKHFPGHGDTTIDSHLATPVLLKNLDQLRSVEFLPFRAAIEAGVDAIMTAHLLLPKIDQQIATLSSYLISQILREELGFRGLIVTDALIMAGIKDRYNLTEMILGAIHAGNDILLMPPDAIDTIDIIYQAIQRSEISLDRIYESVDRIYQYKTKLKKPDQPPNLDDSTPINFMYNLISQTIISINSGQIFIPQDNWINLILTDRLNKVMEFNQSASSNIPNTLGATTIYGEISQLDYFNIPTDRGLFVQIYTRGNPFQGDLINLEKLVSFLKDKNCIGGILYGNPYLIQIIKDNFSQPWLFSYGHYQECQQECLDRLFVQRPQKTQGFTD